MKKMKRFVFYKILIITVLFAGCQKVELDGPVHGSPVFTASMAVDGVQKTWQAGVDDYYMFTEFEKDPFDVYVFTGRFEQKNGGNGEVLTIRIRDFQQVFQGLPDMTGALDPSRAFGFVSQSGGDTTWVAEVDTIGYKINFDASPSTVPPNVQVSYGWQFGDATGDTALVPAISHTYDSTFVPNTPVTLMLEGLNANFSAFLTKPISPSNNTGQFCSVGFDFDTLNVGSLQIFAQPTGVQPFSYNWSDGSTANYYEANNPVGQVNASVTVTDANGCQAIAGVSTQFGGGTVPIFCAADFGYTVELVTVDTLVPIVTPGDSLQFSMVTIEYTDGDGTLFRSDLQDQGPGASFKILEVEDYDDNEQGEKTKKLTVQFTCRLWDAQGNFIDMTNGEGVIAVAYP